MFTVSAAMRLQMAVGTSVYNPETDGEYDDVFRRADSAMYKDKKLKKPIMTQICLIYTIFLTNPYSKLKATVTIG